MCGGQIGGGVHRDYCTEHSLYAMEITQKVEEEQKRNEAVLDKKQKPSLPSILATDILTICITPLTFERLVRELASNLYLPPGRKTADIRLFKAYIDLLVKEKLLAWKGRSRRGDDFYLTVKIPEQPKDDPGLRLIRERWSALERRAPTPPPPPPPRICVLPNPKPPRPRPVKSEPVEVLAEVVPVAQPILVAESAAPEEAPPPMAELSPAQPAVEPEPEPEIAETTATEASPPAWSDVTLARWTALRALPEKEALAMLDRLEESPKDEAPEPEALPETPLEEPLTRPTMNPRAVRLIATVVSELARGGTLKGHDVLEVIRGMKVVLADVGPGM